LIVIDQHVDNAILFVCMYVLLKKNSLRFDSKFPDWDLGCVDFLWGNRLNTRAISTLTKPDDIPKRIFKKILGTGPK